MCNTNTILLVACWADPNMNREVELTLSGFFLGGLVVLCCHHIVTSLINNDFFSFCFELRHVSGSEHLQYLVQVF